MSRSKSGLFLMELIIAIAFFAMSSAVCVQLFAMAHTLSVRSISLQNAVIHAQSAAETFKLVSGDMDYLSHLLEADLLDGNLVAGFDESWGRTSLNEDIRFEMTVHPQMSLDFATAVITIVDNMVDEEIYSITVRRYLGVV